MKRVRNFNLVRPSTSRRSRCGATAIEFALVCPIVLTIMFGMIEVSRMSTIVDAARTSVITGAREARVANATSVSIEDEMGEILSLYGVRESTIDVTPETIDSSVSEITIDIDVPFNSANGLFLVTLPQSNNLTLTIDVSR